MFESKGIHLKCLSFQAKHWNPKTSFFEIKTSLTHLNFCNFYFFSWIFQGWNIFKMGDFCRIAAFPRVFDINPYSRKQFWVLCFHFTPPLQSSVSLQSSLAKLLVVPLQSLPLLRGCSRCSHAWGIFSSTFSTKLCYTYTDCSCCLYGGLKIRLFSFALCFLFFLLFFCSFSSFESCFLYLEETKWQILLSLNVAKHAIESFYFFQPLFSVLNYCAGIVFDEEWELHSISFLWQTVSLKKKKKKNCN